MQILSNRAVIGACIFLISATGLMAQQSIEKQRSFSKLIAEGFEIRAVTQAAYESAKQADAQVYVTLQRGKDVAVCTINHANWSNMRDDSLGSAERCDVRSYK